MATGYNDTLNTAYMPVPLSIPGYAGPTGGNWINWTVNANTIQANGPTGATGTTMTLSVPSGGILRATVGGTGAMLVTTNNVYLGQGAGWNNGYIRGYTGSAYGYGLSTLFGITGATGSIGIGVNAAAYGQASNSIAIGNSAGIYNQGPGSVAIGYYAAGYTGFTGGYTGGQGPNSIAIGYQAGYQNDNTSTITAPYIGFNSAPLYGSSYVFPGAASNNVGGFSYNGQYIGFCQNGTATIYLSNNYGGGFTTNVFAQNIFGYNISSTGQYHICTTNTTSLYYSSNYGSTFTTIILPTVCYYGGYLGSRFMSSNGRFIFMVPLVGTTGVPLYSNNGGPIGTPTFSVFPATSGLSQTTIYGQSSMDTSGNYIITVSQGGTGVFGFYYSNNGTAGVANVTFTNLLTGTNGLPVSTYYNSCAISGNARYMLVASSNATPYITYLSSNANASVISTITFSPINQLPGNISDFRAADISDTGQYMVFVIATVIANSSVYVSYNYGVNWNVITGVTGMVHITMSLNGYYIMALPNTTSATPANGLILVLTTIPSNTNDIAIGYQAGYQNQNGNAVAIGTSAGSINQPVNGVAIGNNAGYTQDLYTYGAAVSLNTSSYTTGSAVWTASISSNGQYMFFGTYQGYSGPGVSQNFGNSFSGVNTAIAPFNNVTIGGSVMSANGQYLLLLQVSSSAVYYSANATASPLLITTTLITGIAANGPAGTAYGNYAICMSSTGQYIIIGNTSTGVATNNYVYYSSNGGPLSTPSTIVFTNLTIVYPSCGVPAAQTTAGNGLWYMSGMSSNGQYIIMPYATTSTGTQRLYYSSNGTAGATSITFSTLPLTCGIPALGINASGSSFIRQAGMSGSGQYILVNVYGGYIYLSSNGTAGASNVTFTCISGALASGVSNGLPTTVQNWGFNGVSSTGQYMFLMVFSTANLYVSTNYGTNWVFFTVPTNQYGGCAMSNDGSKIVICSNTGVPSTNYSYTLQQNTVANTIAIGYNAGYYNQPSGSFFVSTSSLRTQTNGQTLIGGLAYSATTGEVYYSTAKTFVIDHPLDHTRYLVHACLEGPEVGVYYRGTAEITDGHCVTVTLPAYTEALAYDFTAQVMAIQDESQTEITTASVGAIRGGQFKIYSTTNCVVHWHVYGKRGDIQVDPRKDSVQTHGNGPYKWLTNK